MTPLKAIQKEILDHIKAPVLCRVDRSYVREDEGGYCLDASVLRPQTLEETGEILKEVPLSPLWAGPDGRGIYCPPEAGQVVVVSFVEFNPAFPFVSAVYGEGVRPAEGQEGAFVLTDGKGGVFALEAGSLFTLKNSAESLGGLLEELIGEVRSAKVVGPDGLLPLSPEKIAALELIEARIGALLK